MLDESREIYFLIFGGGENEESFFNRESLRHIAAQSVSRLIESFKKIKNKDMSIITIVKCEIQ